GRVRLEPHTRGLWLRVLAAPHVALDAYHVPLAALPLDEARDGALNVAVVASLEIVAANLVAYQYRRHLYSPQSAVRRTSCASVTLLCATRTQPSRCSCAYISRARGMLTTSF